MNITKGKIQRAQKIICYGPEGIGKSTFAAQFPEVVFIDTEGSTMHLDVARTDKPSSWTSLLEQVRYFKANPNKLKTLAIDTADWAEALAAEHICSKSQKSGIEDFGYGKGYTYLEEEFGRFLNLLEEIVEAGVNVVVTAHATIKKFEQPDEMGSYDRWELKLEKKTAPLLKEWADMVLFANYKTLVINVDGQGATKGKNKAQGNKRVMYTSHTPSWDAKNRHNLPDELPFDYASIAHCIPIIGKQTPVKQESVKATEQPKQEPVEIVEKPKQEVAKQAEQPKQEAPEQKPVEKAVEQDFGIPKALSDLMKANSVSVSDIQMAVASRGYYPEDTPIEKYDPQFINGVLVAAWTSVYGMIKELKMKKGEFVRVDDDEELPFN
jgi:hypothetical protein